LAVEKIQKIKTAHMTGKATCTQIKLSQCGIGKLFWKISEGFGVCHEKIDYLSTSDRMS
jgi:hypothetical protein